MRRVGLTLGVGALLAGLWAGTALAAAPACQMVEIASLPIVMIGNRPIIQSQINGKPARLMVDTGAAATTIWRSAAPRYGIQERTPNGGNFYGVGGASAVMTATLGELKLDKTVAHNVRVLVAGEGDNFGGDAGVLGEDFLSVTDVEFDFAGGAIRLFQPRNCSGDQVVYWGKAYSVAPILAANSGRGIIVEVKLNGRSVRAMMDTGASHTTVTTGSAGEVGVTPTSLGVKRNGSATGLGAQKVDDYEGVFQTFGFGDETIKNARLEIADLFGADKEVEIGSHIATSVFVNPGMLLGADFFRAHRIYVSRQQNKVYVSYVGGPVFESPPAAPAHVAPAGK